jgi:hypothetical protein
MFTLMNLDMLPLYSDITMIKTSMLLNLINLVLNNMYNLLKKVKDKAMFLNLLICSSLLEHGIDSKSYSLGLIYRFGYKQEL